MSILVGSARIDENGNISGGEAGDQTGKEVCTQAMYVHSKGWYVLRPKNVTYAALIASKMLTACNNNNIGYDQNNRLGVVKYGVATTTKTEADCSSLVRECVKEATGTDPGDFTTASEASALEATGLFESKFAYVSQEKTPVYNGDILVTKTKGHTVIVVSGNSRNTSESSSSTSSTKTTETLTGTKLIVRNGQIHANNFCGAGIETDGVRGSATKKAGVKVLQQALNRDYNSGLAVDGIWGSKSKAALGNHYVKKGETQYMVTAVEILLMLKGYSPNGVESPGEFGSGCEAAVKSYQSDNGLTADGIAGAKTFMSLIS